MSALFCSLGVVERDEKKTRTELMAACLCTVAQAYMCTSSYSNVVIGVACCQPVEWKKRVSPSLFVKVERRGFEGVKFGRN
jgi:hypothetical protein